MTAAGTQLRAAAALIRTCGLAKGAPFLPDGCICSMHALNTTCPDLIERLRLRDRVLDVIDPRPPLLSGWNDEDDRTEEEVVAVFEKAADIADAEAAAGTLVVLG